MVDNKRVKKECNVMTIKYGGDLDHNDWLLVTIITTKDDNRRDTTIKDDNEYDHEK